MNTEPDMVEHIPVNLQSQHSLSEEGGGDRTWELKGQLACCCGQPVVNKERDPILVEQKVRITAENAL